MCSETRGRGERQGGRQSGEQRLAPANRLHAMMGASDFVLLALSQATATLVPNTAVPQSVTMQIYRSQNLSWVNDITNSDVADAAGSSCYIESATPEDVYPVAVSLVFGRRRLFVGRLSPPWGCSGGRCGAVAPSKVGGAFGGKSAAKNKTAKTRPSMRGVLLRATVEPLAACCFANPSSTIFKISVSCCAKFVRTTQVYYAFSCVGCD